MNPNDSAGYDASLERALRAWEIKEPLPPRFQERVWQRISLAEARAPVRLWTALSNWISGALTRPPLAVSYVAVLLLVGLLAGYWQAQVEKTRTMETLSSRYVGMVDPYKAQGH